LLWNLGVIALLIAIPVSCVLWMTAVPGRSHVGPLPPLTPEQAQFASPYLESYHAGSESYPALPA
jgi:hypothetical protein